MAEEMYGHPGDEQLLVDDLDELIERVLDDAVEKVGESFDVIADRIVWPVKVNVYRRMVVSDKDKSHLAEVLLEDLLDRLDEEHGDPNGDGHSKSEPEMLAAARAFVDSVVSKYKVWACEPTGAVIEISREQAKKSDRR
jgi:hypothetical protein